MRCVVAAFLLTATLSTVAQESAGPQTPDPAPPFPGVPPLTAPPADQPPAIQEASRIGVALGAAQRCGMGAQEVNAMTMLGFARLRLLAKDDALYNQAASI